MLARSRCQMTKQCRSFTPGFKRDAADLMLKQNYSYIEASRSLGIGESALRRWVDQIQKEHKVVTPQSKALTPNNKNIRSWKLGLLGLSERSQY
uniref:Putative transposase n=1 Tax=uncultured proteobacterium QS1 TaxID=288647 RepID=Q6B347_9PROT|nr:putative transposase [uncultured proteobacterium QS1]